MDRTRGFKGGSLVYERGGGQWNISNDLPERNRGQLVRHSPLLCRQRCTDRSHRWLLRPGWRQNPSLGATNRSMARGYPSPCRGVCRTRDRLLFKDRRPQEYCYLPTCPTPLISLASIFNVNSSFHHVGDILAILAHNEISTHFLLPRLPGYTGPVSSRNTDTVNHSDPFFSTVNACHSHIRTRRTSSKELVRYWNQALAVMEGYERVQLGRSSLPGAGGPSFSAAEFWTSDSSHKLVACGEQGLLY
jgi:hypothetical protein